MSDKTARKWKKEKKRSLAEKVTIMSVAGALTMSGCTFMRIICSISSSVIRLNLRGLPGSCHLIFGIRRAFQTKS